MSGLGYHVPLCAAGHHLTPSPGGVRFLGVALPPQEAFFSGPPKGSQPCLASALLLWGFTICSPWVLWILHFLCQGFCLFQGPLFSGRTPCTNQKTMLFPSDS
jgi:hypothetical protein